MDNPVYVPEVLSRGLVPEDLGSFYRQQLKVGSRGVRGRVHRAAAARAQAAWRQRLSYLAIGTYYLFGVTTPLFLLHPVLFLWIGVQPATMRFAEFVTGVARRSVSSWRVAVSDDLQRMAVRSRDRARHALAGGWRSRSRAGRCFSPVRCWPS
jgi:hypothetical protein